MKAQQLKASHKYRCKQFHWPAASAKMIERISYISQLHFLMKVQKFGAIFDPENEIIF
jgi:hypothetical protein